MSRIRLTLQFLGSSIYCGSGWNCTTPKLLRTKWEVGHPKQTLRLVCVDSRKRASSKKQDGKLLKQGSTFYPPYPSIPLKLSSFSLYSVCSENLVLLGLFRVAESFGSLRRYPQGNEKTHLNSVFSRAMDVCYFPLLGTESFSQKHSRVISHYLQPLDLA